MPDLLAQKILGSDPQVGFGQGDVLPYRKHGLDTSGLDAIERANTRKAAQEESRRKNNEDYFHATVQKLPLYRKEVSAKLDQDRKNIIDRGVQLNKSGINLANDREYTQMLKQHAQDAAAADQLHADYEKETAKPGGKYTNVPSRNGELLKNLTDKYQNFVGGDPNALNGPVTHDPSNHFNSDEYLNDQYSKIAPTKRSNDSISNGALGQEIRTKEQSARFWTKDANGNMVPGIGQEHIDQLMKVPTEDPDSLQFRKSVYNVVDAKVRNKALELKQSDPGYADMGVTEIEKRISSNPEDRHYKDFNKEKIQNEVVREQIQKFQTGGEDNSIKSGHAYPKPDKGSSDDDKVTITTLYNQTRNTSADNNGVKETKTAWYPVEFKLGGKRLDKPIKINADIVYDEETNESLDPSETIGDNTFSPTRVIKEPYDTKTGKFLAGSKEDVLKNKNLGYKYMVLGLMKSEDPKASDRKVKIPLDKIQGEMKTGYGFDLSNHITKEDSPKTPTELSPDDTDTSKLVKGEKYILNGKTYTWNGATFK